MLVARILFRIVNLKWLCLDLIKAMNSLQSGSVLHIIQHTDDYLRYFQKT